MQFFPLLADCLKMVKVLINITKLNLTDFKLTDPITVLLKRRLKFFRLRFVGLFDIWRMSK